MQWSSWKLKPVLSTSCSLSAFFGCASNRGNYSSTTPSGSSTWDRGCCLRKNECGWIRCTKKGGHSDWRDRTREPFRKLLMKCVPTLSTCPKLLPQNAVIGWKHVLSLNIVPAVFSRARIAWMRGMPFPWINRSGGVNIAVLPGIGPPTTGVTTTEGVKMIKSWACTVKKACILAIAVSHSGSKAPSARAQKMRRQERDNRLHANMHMWTHKDEKREDVQLILHENPVGSNDEGLHVMRCGNAGSKTGY